jgi:nucleotide-binding universal stress UspA family protein
MSFKKILLAIDDSKYTENLFKQGLEVAKIHQADLMLFRCIPNKDLAVINSIPYEIGLGIQNVNYNYQEEQEKLNRVTEENLEKIKHECEIATNHQLKIEYKYTIGDPGACICETAQDWSASMIVIGRKGHSAFVEALLGSVSNYVIHHAHCAVLVISPSQSSP